MGSEDEEASSQPETRRSPRKSKRKLSSSPKPPVTPSKNVTKDSKSEPAAKRRKLPEEAQILESGELKLSFSPEKKPSKNHHSTLKKPETPTLDLSCNEDTPSICEALGLVRSDKSPKISTITTPELNKTPENASVKPVAKDSESNKKNLITKNMMLSPEKTAKKPKRGKDDVQSSINEDDKGDAKKLKHRLDVEKLASASAKILSSLQTITKPKEKSNEVEPPVQINSDIRCRKTELFVFQNKLPFGMFEEDL